MKPTVYLETSVIGYLATHLSSILRVAANQQTTRDWWDRCRHQYELYISRFVLEECDDGDPVAAEERLSYLEGIASLEASDTTASLADSLIRHVPLPEKAATDALHIAIATVHGVEYLMTWNCKHIANPSLRWAIERVCRQSGYEPPVICTPQELLEIDDDL